MSATAGPAARPDPPGYGGTGQVEVGPARGAGTAHLLVGHELGEEDPTNSRRPTGFAAVWAAVQRLLAAWNRTRAARANARFGQAGGGVLTGGIAYSALFSVAAALTLGFTVLTAVLGNDVDLRERIARAIDTSLPGLVAVDGSQGLVDVDELQLSSRGVLAGVVAAVVLLVTATNAMAALRTAVRAMFAAPTAGQNLVGSKLRELVGVVGIGLAVVVSALLGLAVTTVVAWLTTVLGVGVGAGVTAAVAGVAVAFLADAATFVLLVRVLAAQDPPRRDLLQGAAITGLGLGVVRVLGTSAVAGSASRNPLFATAVTLATLLVWINLISRIVLLAAAWTADPSLEELQGEGPGARTAEGPAAG
ncbi:YihY/virulence factor BrkB family protein [Cellulomonas marina]|uniref:Membrane protein n=1 Tax=Cellulomonas marina TaxID=988821 RepID=A0A1I0ZMD6_9CELL|nr:YihY/virulence factor BrkB family protein [Cellulomonas marina]GIG28624.1 hypothetical protein Cma02nite_12240 [Cellulomonas marina]SFB25538.1 membrane protein [Cellulomonas marina]